MFTPVPKPQPREKKKPKPLRQYRKRDVASRYQGLFSKPPEYDRKLDLLSTKECFIRDRGLCQWCLLVLGKQVQGTQVHHIFGRRKRWDIDSKILLCFHHHECYHKSLVDEEGNKVTKNGFEKLVKQASKGDK